MQPSASGGTAVKGWEGPEHGAKPPAGGGGRASRAQCRVEGCTAPLQQAKRFYQRQHICERHFQALSITDANGRRHRFCQQCTRLHPISEFEGTKRSCRSSLARRQVGWTGDGSKEEVRGREVLDWLFSETSTWLCSETSIWPLVGSTRRAATIDPDCGCTGAPCCARCGQEGSQCGPGQQQPGWQRRRGRPRRQRCHQRQQQQQLAAPGAAAPIPSRRSSRGGSGGGCRGSSPSSG